jgi:hypothetical protein
MEGEPAASAPLLPTVYATTYDHVWATLHKVEFVNASGAAETVIEDASGKVLALKTLRDAAGARFAFLS